MAKYDSRLDHLFTALGDPTRRGILTRLARGRASVSELSDGHDMALPSFVAHLKKLEDAGLINSTKQGRVRMCALAPEALTPARHWLEEQRAVWKGRLDRLDDHAVNLMKARDHGTGSED